MSSSPLPLNIVVNVAVQIAPQNPAQPVFDEGLIVGNSTVIPSVGANSRLRPYTSLLGMISDGFLTSSPEYIAASLYFGQLEPPTVLWVGRQDATSLLTVVPHAAAEGSGYAVGDLLNVLHAGASGGVVVVTTIGVGGAVTGVALAVQGGLIADGTGYVVSTGNATTAITGAGAGAQIDINAVGETPLIAIQQCRAANSTWYSCYSTTALTADHIAIAAWIQANIPNSFYFYDTSDASALSGIAGNVFSTLAALSYTRVLGIYSTTQSGAFPNNIYAGAAIMGIAMGMNNGLVNSAYTLKFKQLVGVAPEPLALSQVTVIEGNNGNLYLTYAGGYKWLEQGVVPSGQFFDEILNLDMLSSAIQIGIINLLFDNPKIPQTDAGETQLIHAVNQACETARQLGFIAAGVWEGDVIIALNPGQPLPSGYLAQAYPYSTQLQADRIARKAMPIYVAIIEAGAVHSVLIGVFVQR